MKFAKIGAVLYVIWGLLHIVAAMRGFQLGASLEPGLVQGKINQGAWDLLFIFRDREPQRRIVRL
jgi:hypothetical protein